MQALHDLTQGDSERRALETLPNYDPTFMKEGPLQKKGQMLKGWKQRWFVCDGRTLSYYSNRRESRPSVVLELKYCTVEDGGRSETWNSTRIHLTDNATGTLYCLTSEDGKVASEWLTVFTNCIARINNERRQRMASQPALSLDASTGAAATASRSHGSEKRNIRMVSAPTSSTSTAGPAPASSSTTVGDRVSTDTPVRPVAMPTGHSRSTGASTASTSVTMENELARDMELLRTLLGVKKGTMAPVVFSPMGASNGVIKSLGANPNNKSNQSQWYARGSVMLSVPSEVASYFLSDHTKRADWDVQFPLSTHVAKFDDKTELVHLSKGFRQIRSVKPFTAPHIAATAGALVGALVASSWATTMNSMALFALIAAVMNSIDYSSMCAPRDLLVMRQVRKTKTASAFVPEDEDERDDPRQTVITVLEKSVSNERKPAVGGVIRAHQALGGWLLEPLDGGRTLVTYVTDIDARGWLSAETKREFMLQRLDSLAVLAEHVNQSQLSVAQLGLDDDGDSVYGSEGSAQGDANDRGPSSTIRPHVGAFHPRDYVKGMSRVSSGGLKLIDKEIAKKQAGVLKDVLKSASGALLEGKGMVGLSLPVRIFEPRTNLERIVDLFLYAPTFLNTAADQSEPLERFKFVMAYAVAGLHHGAGQMKPFNPILGETYQTLLNDGTEVYCEHTSHHPPITNFELLGKKYTINGHVVWNSPSFSMKSSAFIQNIAGPIRISFPDGTVISYHLPLMQSGGFLWGDRTVDLLGSIRFEDPKNNLLCDLKFNPDEKKGMGGMFSSAATPSDFVRGTIINTSTQAELVSVSGSWLDGLDFDEKPYWTFGKEQSGFAVPLDPSKVLESDSVKREDLRYLAADDLDDAQEWKVKLEVLQRADRKIRNEGRQPNHWSLKDGKSHH